MTARVEAERAIADVLLAHRVKSTDRGVAHCACGFTCWTTHENHLARLIADLMAERQAEAWDEGHEDGCIAAHCYTQRGQSYFDESKLTDCHTRHPYRPDPKDTRDE